MPDSGVMPQSEDLAQQSQRVLLEFLETELALGATFIELALTERNLGNSEHFERSKRDAEIASQTARRLANKLVRGESRASVEERCTEVDEKISSLHWRS